MDPYYKAVKKLLSKPHREAMDRAYARVVGSGKNIGFEVFLIRWQQATAWDDALDAVKAILRDRMREVEMQVAGMQVRNNQLAAFASKVKGITEKRKLVKQLDGFQIDPVYDDLDLLGDDEDSVGNV